MKTAEFLSALRGHAGLPVHFSLGRGRAVPAGYHLTEVKRVAFETMDCGAATHRWQETHFELWVPPLRGLRPVHMPAEKFLGIVGRVEAALSLDGAAEAKVFFGEHGRSAVLCTIEEVAPVSGRLEVRLAADAARCKAAERRLEGVAAKITSCCGPSCCRGEKVAAAAQPAATACCDSEAPPQDNAITAALSPFPAAGLRLAF